MLLDISCIFSFFTTSTFKYSSMLQCFEILKKSGKLCEQNSLISRNNLLLRFWFFSELLFQSVTKREKEKKILSASFLLAKIGTNFLPWHERMGRSRRALNGSLYHFDVFRWYCRMTTMTIPPESGPVSQRPVNQEGRPGGPVG